MSPLFESRQARAARRRQAMRECIRRTEGYVARCEEHSRRYEDFALDALQCQCQPECDRYLLGAIRWREEKRRWRTFLLKLREFQLIEQGNGAMQDVIAGVSALNKSLRERVSHGQISRVFTELRQTSGALATQFELLHEQLDSMEPGATLAQTAGVEGDAPIPEAYRDAVNRERARLLERQMAIRQPEQAAAHSEVV